MAIENGEIPVVRWTKKGLLICPTCSAPVGGPQLGREHALGRGTAQCKSTPGQVHLFQITTEAAIEINKLWDRLNGSDKGISKEFIKNIEEPLEPKEEGDGDGTHEKPQSGLQQS